MGPEFAIPLLLGGTAAQIIGARKADNERRAILNRSLQNTSRTQDRAQELIDQEGKKYAPESRTAEMQAQQAALEAQQRNDVGGATIQTAGDTGNVSDDFLKAKADSAISEGNRLTARIRELAGARAPGAQVNAEGLRRAGVLGNVGSMWSSARGRAQAGEAAASNVDMPWWGQLGKVASAVGGAVGGMPPGIDAAAGATNPALIESAVGTGGYGASSAAAPGWWAQAARAARVAPRIRFGG